MFGNGIQARQVPSYGNLWGTIGNVKSRATYMYLFGNRKSPPLPLSVLDVVA